MGEITPWGFVPGDFTEGPPNHLDDKADSDQQVVNKAVSPWYPEISRRATVWILAMNYPVYRLGT